ncbi:MAG: lipopolysaccharide heptosyltransferase II [Endomicrobia bacterium]|nr:lipopolysaccharide heptosyltransferase II [Endomicrobiia bacterium]MCL2506402.1 lipopolysaccharide heptosyltransferase II [Endomicrobiia bacterium]
MKEKVIVKIIPFLLRLLSASMRKKILNETHYYPEPAVYAFWHGSELSIMLFNQNSGIVIMVSLSKDGELLSQVLKSFGYNTVRGSSSKRGDTALLEIIKLARDGKSFAFASDGPRGPYHKLKAGLILAAMKSGLPVIPVSVSPKYRITLNNWDKTVIPLPFTKAAQIYGNPIYVKETDDIEEKRVQVETELNKLFEFTDKIYWNKDIAKYLELHPFPKILIVQPSRIGDIIFALPVLSAIKKKYPKAKISWIVDERCAEILEDNPYLDKIFIWNRKLRSASYYLNLRKQLRAERFDVSIDLHGLFKSAMLVRLAGAKYKIASSSTNGMREFSWLFSKQIKNIEPEAHCVERHMSTAQYLNCDNEIEYQIAISQKDIDSVKEKLKAENVNLDKIIGIHPGGGWVSRRWDTYKFAMLSKKLKSDLGADIVLIGGKEGGSSEKGLNDEIISEAQVKITDMTGKFTLKELCAFFKICRVFVGNEAGPMHIATALNTPAVAILGPTNAKRTGPYKGNTQIIQHQVSCQPCRNRNCTLTLCMRDITVEEVFKAVKEKYENPNN